MSQTEIPFDILLHSFPSQTLSICDPLAFTALKGPELLFQVNATSLRTVQMPQKNTSQIWDL